MADMISDGEDGLLVPAGDARALGAAMAKLIDNPEWCRSLGLRAARSSGAFSENALMPDFEHLYEATAAAYAGRRRGRVSRRARPPTAPISIAALRALIQPSSDGRPRRRAMSRVVIPICDRIDVRSIVEMIAVATPTSVGP